MNRTTSKHKLNGFCYDSYRPNLAEAMVVSMKSYISSKPRYERKSSLFLEEIRRKLWLIHDYNNQVTKISEYKYPRSKSFDMLLIQYLELEFEVLYHNHKKPSKSLENVIEKRILLLLQVLLFKPVYNAETLINLHNDRTLKMEVLKLIAGVHSDYLAENTILNNIAKKLVLHINDNRTVIDSINMDSYLKDTLFPHAHKYLATSDYGTDESDSDDKPLRPIPTVELLEDDDYMVYLSRKLAQSKNSVSNVKALCDSTYETGESSSDSFAVDTKPSQNDVVICSDSEDEVEKDIKREKYKPVVTFEIMDDDDDDNSNDVNYMVYLRKEFKASNNNKIKKDRKKVPMPQNEVIICSDSEDEKDEKPQINQTIIDNNTATNNNVEYVKSLYLEDTLDDALSLVETSPEELPQNFNFSPIDNLLPLENYISVVLDDNLIKRDDLIDPALVFHDVPTSDMSKEQFFDTSFEVKLEPLLGQSDGVFGDPVFSEKQDVEDLQECRLNDSFLEELLLDNSYFDGRKEFDELESFLFDTSHSDSRTRLLESLDDILESPQLVHDENKTKARTRGRRKSSYSNTRRKRKNKFDHLSANQSLDSSKKCNKRSKR